jgi:anti-sigma factor RsiW
MRCEDWLDRFDDYLDGRLDHTVAAKLRAHVAGCSSCTEELAGVRELRKRVADLPRSLEPRRDLWPAIAARISDEEVVRGRFGRRALLAAAAAVVVMSAVVGSFYIGRSQAIVTTRPAPAVGGGPSAVLLATLENLGVNDYQATRRELVEALEARKHQLSPETMDVVAQNLRLIDDAMDRIARALGEDPQNEFLMKRLAGAYRRQIDLLRRAVRMPAEV